MFRAPLLPRTLDAALRDLGAARPNVRAEAARDLARHEADARDRVIAGLQKALGDESAQVRAAAATALADIGGVEAVAELIAAVDDKDALAAQMAVRALGEIGEVGDPRVGDRLRRALSDARAEVRFQAVIAYPRVAAAGEDAVTAIVQATRDADPLVCHIALRMAEELAHDGGDPADIDERVMMRARALVGHASPDVRVASAILLAPRGDKAARDVIVSVARGETKTRDREDEAAAVELAGRLQIRGAIPGLERRAFGGLLGLMRDPFAWHARVALARMGHERAEREILRELSAGDRDLRTLAVAAAGRARLLAARERIAAMKGDERRADPDAVDEALAALAAAEKETGAPQAAPPRA
ncbi:MAG: HEAT repeat domain-containing protein [Minicystis sp.]